MSQTDFKNKGNDAFKAKSFAEAVDWYTKAINVDPDCEEAAAIYSNRAQSYIGMAKFKEAINDADACIRLRPTWLKGHYRKGCALESLNQLDAAAKAFEDALRAEPDNDDTKSKVSTLRARIKERNDKARPEFLQNPEDCKQIGNSFFSAGKYEDASKFYSRALELADRHGVSNEDKATFHANRAACRQQIHDFQGMIDDANAALGYNPNHVKALLRRALAYEGLEKWQLALDDYNSVNRINPGMPSVSQGVVRCQRALRG